MKTIMEICDELLEALKTDSISRSEISNKIAQIKDIVFEELMDEDL
jgi:hypothetical protein